MPKVCSDVDVDSREERRPHPYPRARTVTYDYLGKRFPPPPREILDENARHGWHNSFTHNFYVDEVEKEEKEKKPLKPTCPLHPKYSMELREVDTKYGPAQLHHCPHEECPVSCFGDLEARDQFLNAVATTLHVMFKEPHCPLVCFCSNLMRLKMSKSEKNPNRLFFTCRGDRCKAFQWGDEKVREKLGNHWDWYMSK